MRTQWRLGWAVAVVFLFLLSPAAGRGEPAAQPVPPEPDGSFLGDLNDCKRVVFVVDFSGSMSSRIASVKREVECAIDKLKPSVSFDLIAFDRDAKRMSDALLPADEAGKRKGFTFLDDTTVSDIDFRGTFTDPWPAMRAAWRLEPDRICLVTDGDFPREDDFAARVCGLAGAKPTVRVDTLAWVQSPAALKPFVSLRLIARHTRGKFLCVTEQGKDDPYYHQFEERDLPRAKPAEGGASGTSGANGTNAAGDAVTRVELAGLTSPAGAVAFVYDTSLPPALRERAEGEISAAIGRMDKNERFSVIGFGARGAPAPFSPTLVLAVPENARRVAQWLSTGKALVPAGPADEPLPTSAALDLAFRQHAEAVYLLYGPDVNLEEVGAKLADLNRNRPAPVRAYLVAVVSDRTKARQTVKEKLDDVEFALPIGPPDEAATLPRSIAEENDGAFEYLAPSDAPAPPASRPAEAPAKPKPRPPARKPEHVEELNDPAGGAARDAAPPSIFGDVGDAEMNERVVFLCGSFRAAPRKAEGPKSELRKAILGLKPAQLFDVLFASDRDSLAAFPGGVLVSATRDNKRSALRFLDNVTVPDDPDPIPALEKAFDAGPTTIFLFTDGNLPKPDGVAKRVGELNRAGKVRVSAVVLQGARPEDPACIDVLKRIAADNGGTYRHVTEKELEKPAGQ